MALYKTDARPVDISLSDAYTAIRDWYQKHSDVEHHSERPCEADYLRGPVSLIKALPPAKKLTDIEKIAVLREILFGYLEWGFHKSDGKFKMAAYAVGISSYSFTDKEKAQLKKSVLWPYLSPNAKR
jgi:hypothetical protein